MPDLVEREDGAVPVGTGPALDRLCVDPRTHLLHGSVVIPLLAPACPLSHGRTHHFTSSSLRLACRPSAFSTAT
jgi:hypothetical protein